MQIIIEEDKDFIQIRLRCRAINRLMIFQINFSAEGKTVEALNWGRIRRM
jgi:hypothetical protein